MLSHINKTCSSAFYYLYNMRRISRSVTESLVPAFITSRIDYCNSLLYDLPNSHILKLQRIQNATARLVTGGAIHSTKISGNFGPKLNGSVLSNRKSFEKTGPPFEVDHFSRSDRLEFWLNGLRPGKPRFCHVTPLLFHLHWLPISYRIKFKILLLTFKCLYGQAPNYLIDFI